MRKKERSAAILGILSDDGRADVRTLSAQLHVSEVTVRKDLDDLEAQGVIRRIHGAAVLNSSDNISGRLARHYDEKMKIAAKAAELIQDGDTIMVESGSCCALLAAVAAKTKKDLTIVTNSAFIAAYIRESRVQTILLGGIYQHDSQCLVGPMVKICAAGYHVRRFFIGTDGWSAAAGFTNRDQMRAQAVLDMAPSAEHVVVLTESEKFLAPGTVSMPLARPCTVITDSLISPETAAAVKDTGIQILTV